MKRTHIFVICFLLLCGCVVNGYAKTSKKKMQELFQKLQDTEEMLESEREKNQEAGQEIEKLQREISEQNEKLAEQANDKLKNEIAELKKNVLKKKEKISKLKSSVETAQQKYVQLEDNFNEREQKLNNGYTQEKVSLENQLSDERKKIEDLKQKDSEWRQKYEKLNKDIATSQNNKNQDEKVVRKLENSLAAETKKISLLKNEHAKQEGKLKNAAHDAELKYDNLKSTTDATIHDNTVQIEGLKKELKASQALKSEVQTQYEKLVKDVETLKSDLKNSQSDKTKAETQLKKELEKSNSQVKKSLNLKRENEEHVSQLQDRIKQLSDQLSSGQQALSDSKSQLAKANEKLDHLERQEKSHESKLASVTKQLNKANSDFRLEFSRQNEAHVTEHNELIQNIATLERKLMDAHKIHEAEVKTLKDDMVRERETSHTFSHIGSVLRMKVGDFFDGVWGWCKHLYFSVLNFFSTIFGGVGESSAMGSTGEYFSSFWAKTKEIIWKSWTWISSSTRGAYNWLKNDAFQFLSKHSKRTWMSIKKIAGSLWKSIKTIFNSGWQYISKFGGKVVEMGARLLKEYGSALTVSDTVIGPFIRKIVLSSASGYDDYVVPTVKIILLYFENFMLVVVSLVLSLRKSLTKMFLSIPLMKNAAYGDVVAELLASFLVPYFPIILVTSSLLGVVRLFQRRKHEFQESGEGNVELNEEDDNSWIDKKHKKKKKSKAKH